MIYMYVRNMIHSLQTSKRIVLEIRCEKKEEKDISLYYVKILHTTHIHTKDHYKEWNGLL